VTHPQPPEPDGEVHLIDEVRAALDSGEPLELLGLVSMMILATETGGGAPSSDLNELVEAFMGTPIPETTALLTALGQLCQDDALAARCRSAAAARSDALPGWLTQLAQAGVSRTVLMTHVLGDADELVLGVRFADGSQMSGAVNIDHLRFSTIKDAFFVPETIDTVLAVARAGNDDPDTSFADIALGDAATRLRAALERPPGPEVSDTWPSSRALLRWVARLLPRSAESTVPQRDHADILDRFFASPAGVAFDRPGHRAMLETSLVAGTGDPLRWSAARVAQLLSEPAERFPVDARAQLPQVLGAYIRFAHAESGIRDDLTAEALAVFDDVTGTA